MLASAVVAIPGFSEPFSSLSHLIGAAVFLVLGVLLVRKGVEARRGSGVTRRFLDPLLNVVAHATSVPGWPARRPRREAHDPDQRWMIERMLPAGSLNHAIGGPLSRMTPRASWSMPS